MQIVRIALVLFALGLFRFAPNFASLVQFFHEQVGGGGVRVMWGVL